MLLPDLPVTQERQWNYFSLCVLIQGSHLSVSPTTVQPIADKRNCSDNAHNGKEFQRSIAPIWRNSKYLLNEVHLVLRCFLRNDIPILLSFAKAASALLTWIVPQARRAPKQKSKGWIVLPTIQASIDLGPAKHNSMPQQFLRQRFRHEKSADRPPVRAGLIARSVPLICPPVRLTSRNRRL
jgi:hypothetical protein